VAADVVPRRPDEPVGGSPARPAPRQISLFRTAVLSHYRTSGRTFPWRQTSDPYEILVSEFMLQQTQVGRVERAYPRFLSRFPTIRQLAEASVEEVIRAWRGLGYDRRALRLKRTAEILMEKGGGRVPADVDALRALPGVGRATAGAVAAFAFGAAHPFLETNIRAAVIHHFFPLNGRVNDREILLLVEATLDREHPREWYYALMDYGSHLKRVHRGLGRRAGSYRAQGAFSGSTRELRSILLQRILDEPGVCAALLLSLDPAGPDGSRGADGAGTRAGAVLDQLRREGFVVEEEGCYRPA